MTFAILAALSLAPKLGLKQQMMAQQFRRSNQLSKFFVAKGVIYTLFELIGVFILTASFTPIYGFAWTVLFNFYYSISAFNNAGFHLFNNNLMSFQNNYLDLPNHQFTIYLGWNWLSVLIDIQTK